MSILVSIVHAISRMILLRRDLKLGSKILLKRRTLRMRHLNWHHFFIVLLIASAGLGIIGGCDSGEKMVDGVTGNRAVKQYHKSKKDIGKIVDQQAKKLKNIPGDDDQKDDE